jgi:two-component system response regulator RegX3
MSGRILLVDDDPGILDVVSYGLAAEGFEVETAADGEQALAAARSRSFDGVVLDVMLPDLSGTVVCRRVRAESTVPILMLTAKDAELDRVLGLEFGADDYVTKPFSMPELVSRVRAILRRRELDRRASEGGIREVGDLRLDLPRHRVQVEGAAVTLTPSEFRILALLASAPERVFSRRQIMEHLSDTPFLADERACDVHIFKLRRKIERDPAQPERLVTVRGIGYKLVTARGSEVPPAPGGARAPSAP